MTPGEGEALSWLATDDGRIDRPAPFSEWVRPRRAWVEDGSLVWTYGNERALPTTELLETFASLHRKGPDATALFAMRHGVLRVCEHGRPSSVCTARGCVRQRFVTADFLTGKQLIREPLHSWRRMSRWVWGTLRIAAFLCGSSALRLEDVAVVRADGGGDTLSAKVRRTHRVIRALTQSPPEDTGDWLKPWALVLKEAELREHARVSEALDATLWASIIARQGLLPILLTGSVNRFLDQGNVRLRLSMTEDLQVVPLHQGSGLIGAVGMQLALTVAGSKGFAFCSYCAALYSPTRQPRPDERHYCPQCRVHGIPASLAQRDSRDRKRKGQSAVHKRGRRRMYDTEVNPVTRSDTN